MTGCTHSRTPSTRAGFFDAGTDYSNSSKKSRSASSPWDVMPRRHSIRLSAVCGESPSQTFYNDGDNEITGIHVSDGDPGKGTGSSARKDPKPFRGNGAWRAFYTQQHGDNNTFELIRSNTRNDD